MAAGLFTGRGKMTERTDLKYHSAVAFVSDIKVSKQFYIEVLGLPIELDFGKNVILTGGITLWEINPNHIIPERLGLDSIRDRGVNRFEFYFEVEDIETVSERVKTSGADFLHLLHEEPWGQRTIRFFDPDRHLIEIGESLPAFVTRLYNASMTPEQVSQKISIPLERVREILSGCIKS
jgi:catechol 2,3-dioxygenase-like lactoylglutathione lyase family enzyme